MATTREAAGQGRGRAAAASHGRAKATTTAGGRSTRRRLRAASAVDAANARRPGRPAGARAVGRPRLPAAPRRIGKHPAAHQHAGRPGAVRRRLLRLAAEAADHPANASHVLGLPPSDHRVRHLARRIYATYAQLRHRADAPAAAARSTSRARSCAPAASAARTSFVALWERLRAEGRGIIAVSGHIGSIDLLAGAFALRGLPTYGLADDSAYPELFEVINAQRRRWGIEIIPWRNLRRVFSALREPACSAWCRLGLPAGRRAGAPLRRVDDAARRPGHARRQDRRGDRAGRQPARRATARYHARHYDPIEVADSAAGIAAARDPDRSPTRSRT